MPNTFTIIYAVYVGVYPRQCDFYIYIILHSPRFILSCHFQGKLVHGGDKTSFGDHIVLKLDIICSPPHGIHHQKCEVKQLL